MHTSPTHAPTHAPIDTLTYLRRCRSCPPRGGGTGCPPAMGGRPWADSCCGRAFPPCPCSCRLYPHHCCRCCCCRGPCRCCCRWPPSSLPRLLENAGGIKMVGSGGRYSSVSCGGRGGGGGTTCSENRSCGATSYGLEPRALGSEPEHIPLTRLVVAR